MALTPIPLDEITEAHLRRLIAAQAPETLYVEYKRQTYGGAALTAAARKRWLSPRQGYCTFRCAGSYSAPTQRGAENDGRRRPIDET